MCSCTFFIKLNEELDDTVDPDNNYAANSSDTARTQKGPEKKVGKNRDITTENKLDTDGICSYNSSLYQDWHVITCRKLSVC